MANEPNWGKRSTIATYVAIFVTVALFIGGEIWPPDPEHPMSLDFLSKSIVIPPWLALCAVIAIILITRSIVQRRVKRRPEEIPGNAERVILSSAEGAARPAVPTEYSVAEMVRKSEPSVRNPMLADGGSELSVPSPDDYTLRIRRHEDSSTKGLIFYITNERLENIGQQKLVVRTAQSFDSRHKDYCDGRQFNPFVHTFTDPIEGSCNGKNIWLLYKRIASPHLFVGNDDAHPLKWPDNDKSPVQQWKLGMEMTAFHLPKAPGIVAEPLKALKLQIVVIWNPSNNEFFINAYEIPPLAGTSSARGPG